MFGKSFIRIKFEKIEKKLDRVVVMKRIVLTIAVIVVVMFSLIMIPPIAMDLQIPANVVDETSQSFSDEQSGIYSNGKITQENLNGTKENLNAVKVKSKLPALVMTVGNASGKKGSTVSIPVNFKNVSKVGNVGTCNFYLKYDTKVLKVESITAGKIIASPNVNFSSSIDSKNGKISILFLDDTVGSQLIKKDGTFATVTFKIIGSSGTSTVKFLDDGAVGNGKMVKVDNVTRTDGVVKVK